MSNLPFTLAEIADKLAYPGLRASVGEIRKPPKLSSAPAVIINSEYEWRRRKNEILSAKKYFSSSDGRVELISRAEMIEMFVEFQNTQLLSHRFVCELRKIAKYPRANWLKRTLAVRGRFHEKLRLLLQKVARIASAEDYPEQTYHSCSPYAPTRDPNGEKLVNFLGMQRLEMPAWEGTEWALYFLSNGVK